MKNKITAAVEAKRNKDFLIIARTDARAVNGIDDAIQRAKEYISAGAECIFPEAMQSIDEFTEFRKKISGYLLANMTEFGKSPLLSTSELEKIGYNMVIFPLTAFRGILKTTETIYRDLMKNGSQSGFINEIMSREHFYDLIGYQEYEAEDSSLAKRRS